MGQRKRQNFLLQQILTLTLLLKLFYVGNAQEDPDYEESCHCSEGATLKDDCYESIQDAVHFSEPNDEIFVTGVVTIESPVKLTHNVSIYGRDCMGKKAIIEVAFDKSENGGFELHSNTTQVFVLHNVHMRPSKGDILNSAVRSMSKNHQSISIRDCLFEKFRSDKNGTVLFIGTTVFFEIIDTDFIRNTGIESRESGGMLYVYKIHKDSKKFEIERGKFHNNIAEGIRGSGGAMYVEEIYGNAQISSSFHNNSSSDGGAIHMRDIHRNSNVIFEGHFKDNYVTNKGGGCQGGAIRVHQIQGSIALNGDFYRNSARVSCRGGVLAVNHLRGKGSILLSGEFVGNSASSTGGVVSIEAGTAIGDIVIGKTAHFEDNSAVPDSSTIIFARACGICETDLWDIAVPADAIKEQRTENFYYEVGVPPKDFDKLSEHLEVDDNWKAGDIEKAKRFFMRES